MFSMPTDLLQLKKMVKLISRNTSLSVKYLSVKWVPTPHLQLNIQLNIQQYSAVTEFEIGCHIDYNSITIFIFHYIKMLIKNTSSPIALNWLKSSSFFPRQIHTWAHVCIILELKLLAVDLLSNRLSAVIYQAKIQNILYI